MRQAHPTTDFWKSLPGLRLGDVHELREWIGDDGTHRYFLANAMDSAPNADVIAIVAGDSEQLENQLSQWNVLHRLDHPHLVHIYATGYAEVDGQPVVWARMEHPEEDLGSVTLGRPLSVDETREVTRALVSALKYLHSQGWVHSNLDPWNIVAVNNSIKLVAHDVAPADAGLIAADVRALGFTMCQLLSRKRDDELISSRALPPPFDEIVRGCTQRNWDLDQVERALSGQSGEKEPATQIVRSSASPSYIEARRDMPPPNPIRWIYAAVATGLIAALIFLFMGGTRKNRAAQTETAAVAAPPRPITTVVTTSTPAPAKPAPVKSAPGNQAPMKASPAADQKEPADWRVIAYTYSARKDAEERVRRINTRWPDLHPEVFVPRGSNGPYLVALGGIMTRNDAFRLRSKARSSGLPRDTFARNFR